MDKIIKFVLGNGIENIFYYDRINGVIYFLNLFLKIVKR